MIFTFVAISLNGCRYSLPEAPLIARLRFAPPFLYLIHRGAVNKLQTAAVNCDFSPSLTAAITTRYPRSVGASYP